MVEEGTETEIEMIFSAVNHIISYLYELSLIIRDHRPHDKIIKLNAINISHFETWDRQHVEQKFPQANPILLERLSKANTMRRRLFKYYENHHEKLAHDLDTSLSVEPSVVAVTEGHSKGETSRNAIEQRSKSITGSNPSIGYNTSTTATTINTQTTVATFKETDEQIIIDDNLSVTSSAVSEDHGEESTLRVPAPPKGALENEPFECPYCYEIMKVSSADYWR